MKVREILDDLWCTILGSGTGWIILNGEMKYVQKTATVGGILETGKAWKQHIDTLREKPYHSEEQTEFKKHFPCWIPAGVFKQNNVTNNGIETYSNLLAIDIDKIDNVDIDMENVKKEIFNMPQVVFVMKSISGEGIFAVLLVEDGRNTTGYCKYLEKLFIQKYHVTIDKKCYNIARKRFISYDDDILIKSDETDIVPWKLKLIETKEETKSESTLFDYKQKYVSNIDEDVDFERKVDLLIDFGFDIGPHWSNWAIFGRIFKPFNNGKELFERISQKMSAFDSKTFDKDWDRIKDDITDKSHSVAYITTILNKNYPNWKEIYYKR